MSNPDENRLSDVNHAHGVCAFVAAASLVGMVLVALAAAYWPQETGVLVSIIIGVFGLAVLLIRWTESLMIGRG